MFACRLFLIFLFAGAAFASGPNVLSNTDHIVGDVTSAISILGGSNTVNQTCPSSTTPGVGCFTNGGPSFILNTALIANAVDNTVAEYLAGTATSTGTPNSNVPYQILNQSSTGYHLTQYDQNVYSSLIANSQIYVMAYCGGPGTGDAYPPIAASTILPNTTGSLASQTCGYALGIEFSMTAGYKGFATGSPSGTTEAFSGVYAVLGANHPTWTFADIKGALRQTASNWAAGYAPSATPGGVISYGFGNIDYDSANAISSTNNIFLQSPGMTISNHGYYAIITLYPFRSTRRANEVVYIGGTWPAASASNELTASQIAAAGGTLVYSSNGTDIEPVFTYTPAVSGTATFRAFTLDSAGNGSRLESFAALVESFTVGMACFQ